MNIILPSTLVIDDEPEILQVVAAALRTRAHVTLEGSGEDAIRRLCSEELYDLVMLDFMMPDKNGADVLETCIVRCPGRLDRIVITTGAADVPGVREYLARTRARTGAALELFEKPWDITGLYALVRRYSALPYSRGPRKATIFVPPDRPTLSRPKSRPEFDRPTLDLPPMAHDSEEPEETTQVTRLAKRAKDPRTPTNEVEAVAAVVVELRTKVDGFDSRLKEIEPHFENDPSQEKLGMVWQTYNAVKFVKTLAIILVAAIPLVTAGVGILMYLIHAEMSAQVDAIKAQRKDRPALVEPAQQQQEKNR